MNVRISHTVRPIGFTFRMEGRKYHIIGHVQDREKDMFVYVVRFFGKYKQWWHYEVITAEDYDDKIKLNLIEELGTR